MTDQAYYRYQARVSVARTAKELQAIRVELEQEPNDPDRKALHHIWLQQAAARGVTNGD